MDLLLHLAATQAPHGVAALVMAFDPGLAVHPMGPVLALAPLVLGFTRLTTRDVGDNPVRRALLETLAAGRFLSASELARETAVSRKTIGYHLHILQRAGLVVQRGPPSRPVFAGAAHARTASLEARLLEHPNRRAVWEAAKARPGATLPELARQAGLKPGTAHFHVGVLARAGLLEVQELAGQRGFVAARPLTPQEAALPPAGPAAVDAQG